MDGLLVVDKPVGPTSHDVVIRVRRALHERRVGHTGTLDPLASGVLPLVVGRATRLARFLSGADKAYSATLRLGVATDSGDSAGLPIGSPYLGPWPDVAAIDRALEEFRGRFFQQPPALSAKKIAGKRSYRLARDRARRRDEACARVGGLVASADLPAPSELPAPVAVTAHAISVMAVERDVVTLAVECSSGFYMRTLAYDLGERLGVGAHLTSLRRTRSGDATEAAALSLADIEDVTTGRERAMDGLVSLEAMLPGLPAVRLTELGARKVADGRDVCPSDVIGTPVLEQDGSEVRADPWYRLMDSGGQLLALGERGTGATLLHPSVVLV